MLSVVLLVVSRLVLNFFRLLQAPLFWAGRLGGRPKSRWVHVRLRPRLVEIEPPLPALLRYLPGFQESRPTSLERIRRLVTYLLDDDRIDGMVVDVPPLSAGWAHCVGLRDQLERVRQGGKTVVTYLSQGGGNKELFVASASDRMLAAPHAQVAPLGLAASVTYYKGLLDRAGLEVEVLRRAEYKTAAEPATRDSMSEPQREQTEALLATIDGRLREALAARPGFDAEKVDGLFEDAILSAELAKDKGLLDDVCYEDELPRAITEGDEVTPVVRAPRYYAWRSAELFVPVAAQPFVAVISVEGAIMGGTPGTRGGAQLKRVVQTLRSARRNAKIAGVVLHVDSPGGSALASDLIHREVVRLREEKPVVASFGNVAASGGYYVAAGADRVVAQPLTITGSIGVVAARLVTEPVMTRFGVKVETVRRAPHADMLARPSRLEDAEREILDREIGSFYDAFVGVVAAGRGRPASEVEPLARGRVWSGQDAEAQGLVDRLGGLDVAVSEVKSLLVEKGQRDVDGLEARPYRLRRVLELPPADPPVEEAARAFLGAFDPRLGELLALAKGGDRVLAYAFDLPTIR